MDKFFYDIWTFLAITYCSAYFSLWLNGCLDDEKDKEKDKDKDSNNNTENLNKDTASTPSMFDDVGD